jgi:hypothetical protein
MVIPDYEQYPFSNTRPNKTFLGPTTNGGSVPRGLQRPTVIWRTLWNPFHGKEHASEEVSKIGKHDFPVFKQYEYLSPRGPTKGPYHGGPPPEPTWWQKVWPLVDKKHADVDEWFHS